MKLGTLIKIYVLLQTVIAQPFVSFDALKLHSSSFFDQFDYSSLEESGWVVSSGKKTDGSPYLGQWAIEETKKYPGLSGDKALVMQTEAAFYAISKKLPTVFEVADSDVVVQFEVKFQYGVTCSGAYVKLLTEVGDATQFSDGTPFEIMFGPDICGSESRVIFLVKTKVGTETVESRIRNLPMARNNPVSHLYTLVLRKNYDVEIRIDGDVAKAGNLFTPHFMVPPLGTPEYIEDVDAQKPLDWDERRYIADESVSKPADWDISEGAMWIPDPKVRKPAGWNDDESQPEFIRDPEAKKPQEWDDEEDGEWKAPFVKNPECLYGCGHWEPPKIVNPDYKGTWSPPQIANPNFQGVWKPPKIKNPMYTGEDKLKFSPVEALGFELWSMDSGIMFDNVYLGHLVEEAEKIGNTTYIPKSEIEQEDYEINRPKAKFGARKPPKSFEDILDDDNVSQWTQFVTFVQSLVRYRYTDALDFWHMFQADPVNAISSYPFKFACYCFVALLLLTIVLGSINVVAIIYMTNHAAELAAQLAQQKKSKVVEPELTEEEMIAQITGKASGAKTTETTAVKRG